MALTCLLPFLSPDASGLCSSFFSGHYIPSGLISLISHWLGCQNSFLHYCSLLKGSGCWILYHIPFDLLWIFFFFITSISFSFFVYPSGRKRGLIISMKPALLFVSKCWQTKHIYLKKEHFSLGCDGWISPSAGRWIHWGQGLCVWIPLAEPVKQGQCLQVEVQLLNKSPCR